MRPRIRAKGRAGLGIKAEKDVFGFGLAQRDSDRATVSDAENVADALTLAAVNAHIKPRGLVGCILPRYQRGGFGVFAALGVAAEAVDRGSIYGKIYFARILRAKLKLSRVVFVCILGAFADNGGALGVCLLAHGVKPPY